MKIIRQASQSEVISHWEKVEKITIPPHRVDIVLPLTAYGDLQWHLGKVEDPDIDNIYICSSDDWSADGLCIPDFRVKTAIDNYNKSDKDTGKFADIKAKEKNFANDISGLDTRLIMVSDNSKGPFTLIEGCKRSVALGNLHKLAGLEIYLGVSPSIKNYIWARHMYGR